MSDVTCPFCQEDDFDLVGLKHHLTNGHCESFNQAEPPKLVITRTEALCKNDPNMAYFCANGMGCPCAGYDP